MWYILPQGNRSTSPKTMPILSSGRSFYAIFSWARAIAVTNIDVSMALGAAPEALPHLDRVLAQFEAFVPCRRAFARASPLP